MQIVDEETGEIEEVTPITDHLAFLERGQLIEDMTLQFGKLIRAVKKNEKKGSMTLKITVSPTRHGEDIMDVTPELSINAPKPPRRSTLMFSDDTGQLHRQDPRQAEMQLRRIEKADAPLKTAGKKA